MRAAALAAVRALVPPLALGVVLAGGGSGLRAEEPGRRPTDAATALRTGNRLFRQGDAAGAVAAYQRARDEALADDPVLAYNLATALQHLGRLPEAVLWYRRAARGLGDDPWLHDNLEQARAALAAPRIGPPPSLALVLLHPWLLPAAAALAAWSALFLQARAPRPFPGAGLRPKRWRTGAAGALLVLGALLWVAHGLLPRIGPRPAVLLAPCGDALPAGSEVWARPAGARPRVGTGADRGTVPGTGTGQGTAGGAEAWQVRGPQGSVLCPEDAVAPL